MTHRRSLIHCRQCPRLHDQLCQLRETLPDYWNHPVPAAGNSDANFLIVGLAPGRHGANRTGLPFTGDASGDLLYTTLDELALSRHVLITNAVKCLPIDNHPTGQEVKNCRPWLQAELTALFGHAGPAVILALGTIAHQAVSKSLGYRANAFPFRHGAVHSLGTDRYLVDSYHCSRYNTQTGRLTPAMFKQAVMRAGWLAGLTS